MEEQAEYNGKKVSSHKFDGISLNRLFDEVINTRGIHHQLDMNESTVRALRKQFNDGGSITVEKMREVLKKAGYVCIQEELWAAKISNT